MLAVAIDSIVTAPVLHAMYELMEFCIPTTGGGVLPAATHLVLDTFLLDPVFVACFFCTTGLLESRPLTTDVLPALKRLETNHFRRQPDLRGRNDPCRTVESKSRYSVNRTGMYIDSVDHYGIYIYSVNCTGMYIDSVDCNEIYIDLVDHDGIYNHLKSHENPVHVLAEEYSDLTLDL